MTDRTMEALKDIIDVTLRANGRREDVNFLNTLLLKAGDVARAALTPSPDGRERLHKVGCPAEHDEGSGCTCLTPSPPAQEDGNRPLPLDRETLGRMVREAWVRWAQTQPSPKPSWLLPYDDLSEPDKEADRQIGETIARWTLIHDAARNSFCAVPPQEGGIAEVEGLIAQIREDAKWLRSLSLKTIDPRADRIERAAAELSRLSAIVKAQKEALDEWVSEYPDSDLRWRVP